MKFSIDVKDLERLRKSFAVFSDRRFAAGMATALTRTAEKTGEAQRSEMRDVFDRPTSFTMRAVFVEGANAASLTARAGIKDDFGTGRGAIKWLQWHIDGGRRRPKAYENLLRGAGAMPDGMFSVPGRYAKLDAYGNISTGQLRQILSQLRIEPTVGAKSALPTLSRNEQALIARKGSSIANPIAKSFRADALRKRSRIVSAYKKAGGQYVAFPLGRGKLRPGIYQVDRFNRGEIRPVLIFVTRADYEAGRFDFDYVSDLAIRRHLGPETDKAMADQLRRWAAKHGGAA